MDLFLLRPMSSAVLCCGTCNGYFCSEWLRSGLFGSIKKSSLVVKKCNLVGLEAIAIQLSWW